MKGYAIASLGAVLLALAAGAVAQPRSDWEEKLEERNWQEGELKLPAYPKAENLLEYEASAASSFRFLVDADSISATSDGVVRYTLVARSTAGTESVSFNGLRCKARAHRVYATGHSADKNWSAAFDSQWKELQPRAFSRPHQALMRNFFCPAGIAITSRDEGVDALRRGAHPQAVGSPASLGRY